MTNCNTSFKNSLSYYLWFWIILRPSDLHTHNNPWIDSKLANMLISSQSLRLTHKQRLQRRARQHCYTTCKQCFHEGIWIRNVTSIPRQKHRRSTEISPTVQRPGTSYWWTRLPRPWGAVVVLDVSCQRFSVTCQFVIHGFTDVGGVFVVGSQRDEAWEMIVVFFPGGCWGKGFWNLTLDD